MNQSILALRAKLSVNLKIPLTASLKDFEFFRNGGKDIFRSELGIFANLRW